MIWLWSFLKKLWYIFAISLTPNNTNSMYAPNTCMPPNTRSLFTQIILQRDTDESPSSLYLEHWPVTIDVKFRQTNTLHVFSWFKGSLMSAQYVWSLRTLVQYLTLIRVCVCVCVCVRERESPPRRVILGWGSVEMWPHESREEAVR